MIKFYQPVAKHNRKGHLALVLDLLAVPRIHWKEHILLRLVVSEGAFFIVEDVVCLHTLHVWGQPLDECTNVFWADLGPGPLDVGWHANLQTVLPSPPEVPDPFPGRAVIGPPGLYAVLHDVGLDQILDA
jgi:hypothetical protein